MSVIIATTAILGHQPARGLSGACVTESSVEASSIPKM